MFNFKPERVMTDDLIGEGSFGKVYPYQKDADDKKWVVKNCTTKVVGELLKCFQEIVFGSSCDHQHVLPVRGYHVEYDQSKKPPVYDIYIRLPRMKTSLEAVLKEHKKNKTQISELQIAQYFYELVQGLQYLHSRKIAHRDIKPANVLLSEDDEVKIADFGIGEAQGWGTTLRAIEKAGSPFYAAPENLNPEIKLTNQDLFNADLWSLGMILFELCTQMDLRKLEFHSAPKKLEEDLQQKLRQAEGKYSKGLVCLVGSLLREKPSQRQDLKSIERELIANYGESLV